MMNPSLNRGACGGRRSVEAAAPPADAPSSCELACQPQLMEAAVLRTLAGHPLALQFHRERNLAYECEDAERREQAFSDLHERWFERLQLARPLRQALAQLPLLTIATSRCLMLQARSRREAHAELYVATGNGAAAAPPQRTLVVQLTPDMLAQPEALHDFLRRELLHIVDMLDPDFGYVPTLPPSLAGPAHDFLLQQRYKLLWDLTVDGRLYSQGEARERVRAQHWQAFRKAFPGEEQAQQAAFAHFFDTWPHTHAGLLAFAREPVLGPHTTATAGHSRRCALCHFPFSHPTATPAISSPLRAAILADFPHWQTTDPVCPQCLDLYEARSSQDS